MSRTAFNNQWFTLENQKLAIQSIAERFLQAEHLQSWISAYGALEPKTPKRIGLVLAGNIPMVLLLKMH